MNLRLPRVITQQLQCEITLPQPGSEALNGVTSLYVSASSPATPSPLRDLKLPAQGAAAQDDGTAVAPAQAADSFLLGPGQ